MSPKPLWLLAALPLLLLAADTEPQKHEVNLNINGLKPEQFLSRQTPYKIISVQNSTFHPDIFLFAENTGRTWKFVANSNLVGWVPLPFDAPLDIQIFTAEESIRYSDILSERSYDLAKTNARARAVKNLLSTNLFNSITIP